MSIFVTGDIHASYDIAKLSESCFDTAGLTKDDYVIICGDFGLVWNNSASEQYWLRWLDARPFTTLFVDGNHEGFSLLNSLPETTWNGGAVHQVASSTSNEANCSTSTDIESSRWAEQPQANTTGRIESRAKHGSPKKFQMSRNEQQHLRHLMQQIGLATSSSPIVRHHLARKVYPSTPIAWKSTRWTNTPIGSKQFKTV